MLIEVADGCDDDSKVPSRKGSVEAGAAKLSFRLIEEADDTPFIAGLM